MALLKFFVQVPFLFRFRLFRERERKKDAIVSKETIQTALKDICPTVTQTSFQLQVWKCTSVQVKGGWFSCISRTSSCRTTTEV